MLRKTVCLFAALLALAGIAACNENTPKTADARFAAAGIDDAQMVDEFLVEFQAALAKDDRDAVARMISYPLGIFVQGKLVRDYRSLAQVKEGYDDLFTDKVKAAVQRAKPESLFANDQGVMISDGEVWLGLHAGVIKIHAVNP
ncbi:MAG: hypothetical protein DI551_07850 [Micavibrio aeruginosavorus]|uniref:Lipoprotein n=1 Tax=Micavibrio aeruginosavorus TaxID=349221 RepID=A0A2W5N3A1_9BACT|nr:MAG: hypothetical protein DI551_07850 [Micavibrio aeruginosavorus]